MDLEAAGVLVAVTRHRGPARRRRVPQPRPYAELGAPPAVGGQVFGLGRRHGVAQVDKGRPLARLEAAHPALVFGGEAAKKAGRAIRGDVADQDQAAGQDEMRNHRQGLLHDAFEGRGLGAGVAACRQPGLGVGAGQQQVVVARSLPEDAGRRENALRFRDQDAPADVGRALQAQGESEEEQATPIVGQVVRSVVVAEKFEALDNCRGVAGEHRQGLARGARKAAAAREIEDVDTALGGRVGVPGRAVVGGREALPPGPPQDINPGRLGGGAEKRQPGEPVDGDGAFVVGEGAAEKLILAARSEVRHVAGQRQVDGRLGWRVRKLGEGRRRRFGGEGRTPSR